MAYFATRVPPRVIVIWREARHTVKRTLACSAVGARSVASSRKYGIILVPA